MPQNSDSPFSIAILGTRGIPARYGGFETFAEQLSIRLRNTHGVDVTVFCPGRPGTEPSDHHGVRLEYVSEVRAGALTSALWDSACIVKCGRRFDIVYVLGYCAAFAGFLPRLRGSRVWINMDGIEWRRSKWNAAGRLYLRTMEWVATRAASRLIADAAAIRTHLEARHPCANAPTTFIPYGAILPSHAASSTAALPEGLTVGRYHLVVARMEPENHIAEIIDGYSESRCDYPLVLVGDVDERSRYGRRLRAKHHPGVRFVGGVYDADSLTALRSNAATYIHGHSVGGTNPSLLEALACGNVIVAHDNCFNREVLGGLADYFTTKRELAVSLRRSETRSAADRVERARACREAARTRFDWDAVARAYVDLAIFDLSHSRPRRFQPWPDTP